MAWVKGKVVWDTRRTRGSPLSTKMSVNAQRPKNKRPIHPEILQRTVKQAQASMVSWQMV